ncbi:probable pectinesterase/pectinesterase inhibitor 20 [Telopea speciosissima]|uniref:probable pectinesterase/pectinesterase inhibitor 20 n=1 Tax=Telopea speciosissima TaxID=54955 RepID=UPI001CC8056A|nr:probable pectinesterase/pectinesterase inhibitor 20 [Telopea speciosissima]
MRRNVVKILSIEITIGPIKFKVEFQVIDITFSFTMFLGRPWLHATGATASSLHQKLKFVIDVRVITIMADPEVINLLANVESSDKEMDSQLGGFQFDMVCATYPAQPLREKLLIKHLNNHNTAAPNMLKKMGYFPEKACNSTLYPDYCKSILPSNESLTLHDYTRISVSKSLSASRKFLHLIKLYLNNQSSITTISALQDCQLVAELNVDFFSESFQTINSTDSLSSQTVDDVQTMLSATLTNQETCSESLEATASAQSVKNDLSTYLTNGTKFYSVSLSFFTNGWVYTNTTVATQKAEKSGRKLMFYRPISRRKLLQVITGQILVKETVVVNQDGSGNFTTINDAIAAAPNNTNIRDGYFRIQVVKGIYEEYISIDKSKKNIMIVGDGINQTVITGNRSVGGGSTTFNSATLAVVGQGFVAVNLTVRNTAGAINGQAVAVRNGADMSTFYVCSFEGYQDTLYSHSLRQFYRECDIYGTVDFIFGNSAVVFQSCNIYARLPIQGQSNTMTAQGRSDPNQSTGTSIQDCNIRASLELFLSNYTTKTFLGRPWRPYSRTVVMQTYLDSLIDPAGWLAWGDNSTLTTLYYAEFSNTGPGSPTTSRVNWPGYHVINATDAANFTVSNFIMGDYWLPATGVPYKGGLFV